jgi:hypothetical protein
MAMEVHVFFRGELPSKPALTQVMQELGFPLSIAPSEQSLEQHNGYMPMLLNGKETGVEFDVFSGRLAIEDNVGRERMGEIDPAFDRCANFRFVGDWNELLCALCGATALAKLVNGVVYDEEHDVLRTIEAAIDEARRTLRIVSKEQDGFQDAIG